MSHGIVMFDASERLVVCNDRYIEMYGLSRDQVKRGTTLRGLLQLRKAAGLLTRDPSGGTPKSKSNISSITMR